MSITLNFAVGAHWCQIGIYPFSWLMFSQSQPGGPTNYAFGPLRLMFN